MLSHSHIVEGSNASAVDTCSVGCSESSGKMGDHIWQSEFVEVSDPAFSEHTISTDNITPTSSFASEPTVKTQNKFRSIGIMRRDMSGLEVDAHTSTPPSSIVVLPFWRGGNDV